MNFFILRGHKDSDLLEVMNDPCRYVLYKAIILHYYDEEKQKNKNKK